MPNLLSALRQTILAATLLAAPTLPARADPVVLELFTSQGCSSCPPADALLTELSGRPDVLPLALHVDYWNGIGWHDPFSQPILTARQNSYGASLGQDSIYTPELVVNGHQGVVGSDRTAVAAAIAAAQAAASARARVPLSVRPAGDHLTVTAARGQGDATLWLVGYDRRRATRIGGGENGGRTLAETNVVRSLTPVAAWSGEPLQLTVPRPTGEAAAVFLQTSDGLIIAAAD